MPTVVIVGVQWGDEGKGKIVDLCTEYADVVVRYAGGPNAGHTLVVGDDKLIVRLIPSGILREQTRCVLAQGMVIDPAVLVTEMDELERRGLSPATRLVVSDRAHMILPFHVTIDTLRETTGKGGPRLGTTKRGVGPTYEDKAARRGLRMGELRDLKKAGLLVEEAISAWTPTLRALGADPPQADSIVRQLEPLAARIVPLLADTSRLVDAVVSKGQNVMFEGAQGTLLDLDHGTYPFVTSSSASASGACAGSGIGPTRIDGVLGIVKAYSTRVGGGPFPTELTNAIGEKLRADGAEFGAVTGRPRRTGWLDLPAIRYAARVNGLSELAVTKLDVLTGHEQLEVCVAYDTPEGRTDEFPIDRLEHATPVYKAFRGWREPLGEVRSLAELPAAARAYLDFMESSAGVPLSIISVGPRRSETIVLRSPFAPRPAHGAKTPKWDQPSS
ncbi:MAG TPA: adenylosuccinate synthase [Polyangiaceae bacterium]|nr:adenylosuccinate synthase [Polyangiaceae bacterium]